MENAIKVGEYVRDKGLIFCIMGIDYDDYITDIIYNPEIHKGYKGRYDFGVKDFLLYFTKEQIIKMKHSPNLIDLIECGDYVNGYNVLKKSKKIKDKIMICVFEDNVCSNWITISNENLEEIVTKEMMESISYKVKE